LEFVQPLIAALWCCVSSEGLLSFLSLAAHILVCQRSAFHVGCCLLTGRNCCCACRKFACFAIGNAAFHNPSLYGALCPAVAPLVELLSDDEEKTRANAAGALGNLVRNSGQLCGEIIQVRTLLVCACVLGVCALGAADASASSC
jgi:hypothetical protein